MENRKTVVVCGGGTRGDQQPVAMTGAELKKKYGFYIIFYSQFLQVYSPSFLFLSFFPFFFFLFSFFFFFYLSSGYHIVLCCGIESKGWADSFGFEFLEIASIKKVVTKEEDVIEAGSVCVKDRRREREEEEGIEFTRKETSYKRKEEIKRKREVIHSCFPLIFFLLFSTTAETGNFQQVMSSLARATTETFYFPFFLFFFNCISFVLSFLLSDLCFSP